MKKSIDSRIAFYTRKVAERTAVHPARPLPPQYKYRGQRLLQYKKMLHAAIEKIGADEEEHEGITCDHCEQMLIDEEMYSELCPYCGVYRN
ncbi:hypothetical protein [Ectobacillus ponti]|uniref:Uncharacterized protein n=1 Tax=Ectobacillus ponti TaxID=2961894 RepID=A0AA41X6J8_9BACI|nr:hypothetical protein [Ectobacillus ponti]MCP8969737.1 hypothetical protein [Ectobacillus ponti]